MSTTRSALALVPVVGQRVKIRHGLESGGEYGTVVDVTDVGASDILTWRYAVAVEFPDGRRNVYTEHDVE